MPRFVFSLSLVVTGLVVCNSAEARQPFYLASHVTSHRVYRPVVSPAVVRPVPVSSPVIVQHLVPPPTVQMPIQEMPLLMRPNRVGHFYGNTVRRLHYTGRLLPRLR